MFTIGTTKKKKIMTSEQIDDKKKFATQYNTYTRRRGSYTKFENKKSNYN